MGRGIAARLSAAGVPTLLGSRQLERAVAALARIGSSFRGLQAVSNSDVVDRCDLVFLAVPFASVADVLQTYRGRLRPGTVLVDVTVPLRFEQGMARFEPPPEGSAAEHIRAHLPTEIGLAATFKTLPAPLLGRAAEPLDCDEFICGDSPESTARARAALDRIATLRMVDVGGLEAACALEHMTALAITVNKRHKVRAARFRVVGL
jgi:NADPH-dependent F420 reductase